jgi:hypothetical protein
MLLLANYSKGGTHVVAPKGRNSFVDFKCAWKGRGPKLFTNVASNKNEQKSNKNMEGKP